MSMSCVSDRLLNMETWRELAQLRGSEMCGAKRDINEWDNRVNVAVLIPTLRELVEVIEVELNPDDPLSVEAAHLALDYEFEELL